MTSSFLSALVLGGTPVLIGGLIWRVVKTGRREPTTYFEFEKARRSVLWLQLGYLLVLFVLAWLYWQGSTLAVGKTRVTLYCLMPNPVGSISLEVPWFAALGAVLLSLQGVFDHRKDGWDVSYHPWHIARPLVGAGVGVIGYFLFVAGITATGSDVKLPLPESATTTSSTAPAPADDKDEAGGAETPTAVPANGATSTTIATTATTTTSNRADEAAFPTTRRCQSSAGPLPAGEPRGASSDNYLYYALAFILGFREQTFRSLVKRVADVIFGPGTGDGGGSDSGSPKPAPPDTGAKPTTEQSGGTSEHQASSEER